MRKFFVFRTPMLTAVLGVVLASTAGFFLGTISVHL
jgi:hypothetical protein